MAKTQKPAPKGGKKIAAPKKLTDRQIDQLNADKMRAAAFASTQPVRQTVEEHFDSDAALMQALHDPENQPSQYGTVPMSYLDKPSLLRRAWNRVKRVFRYRSAVSGEFVSKKHADANPSTTVREKVRK